MGKFLTNHALQKGHIQKELYNWDIQKEIVIVKDFCNSIISYNWINIPLVIAFQRTSASAPNQFKFEVTLKEQKIVLALILESTSNNEKVVTRHS